MCDAIRLYLRYAGISVRGQMQYRGAFVMQSLGLFLITGIEFISIWALFARFGALRGWTLPEVALIYGMGSVSFALSDAASRGFDVFGQMVKSGDFDRLLLRPRSTALQVAGQELTLRRVGRLSQGLVALIWGLAVLPAAHSPARLGLLAFAIAGGSCFFTGLLVLQATAAFWTVESLEIFNVLTYGGVTAVQYPLSIYKPWFQRLFTFVIPLASVNFLPSQAILGRSDAPYPPLVHWLAPLAGVAFLLVSLRAWELGVRHYPSTSTR